MELWEQINLSMNQLNAALKSLRTNGTAKAQAEYDYKTKLSEKVLILRDEGKQTTLIPLIVYGDKEVALLRMKRDIAEVTYDACKESININKKELDMLKIQWEKEYDNG